MPDTLCMRRKGETEITVEPSSAALYKTYLSECIDLNRTLMKLRGMSHVQTVLDVFCENNTAYAVFEYINGISLKTYLANSSGEIAWEQAKELFSPFFTTLSLIHSAGILHRGISPSTIFVTDKMEMKLTGFAISAARTTGTEVANAYQEKDKLDVYYWFGSDLYGRDIWTRTLEGARVSLIIAVASAVIDMVSGMSYGLFSGYFGGKVDMQMQRFHEVANGIPRLVIVTLLLLVLQPGMVTIIFALMLTEWVGMSRIARAEMLKLKDQEFVLASRTLGAGSFFIIF